MYSPEMAPSEISRNLVDVTDGLSLGRDINFSESRIKSTLCLEKRIPPSLDPASGKLTSARTTDISESDRKQILCPTAEVQRNSDARPTQDNIRRALDI
jgi:hypothetical protein